GSAGDEGAQQGLRRVPEGSSKYSRRASGHAVDSAGSRGHASAPRASFPGRRHQGKNPISVRGRDSVGGIVGGCTARAGGGQARRGFEALSGTDAGRAAIDDVVACYARSRGIRWNTRLVWCAVDTEKGRILSAALSAIRLTRNTLLLAALYILIS